MDSLQEARLLLQAVIKNFFRDGALREYSPPQPGDPDYAFLWSCFAFSGMLFYASKADPQMADMFRKMLLQLRCYRDPDASSGMCKYHSERGPEENSGHAMCFFDDNIWIARNMLFAYDLFRDPFFLEEAEKIASYVRSGWDRDIGGLVWNEQGLTDQGNTQELERGLSANACSVLVHARLFEYTGSEEYLAWALNFHNFCSRMRDPDTGIYYNGIHTVLENGRRKNGRINKDLYGYNSGLMILSDVCLYRITGEKAWLEDAIRAAAAVHQAHIRTDENGIPFYRDFVWFTAIQAEAYLALLPYDPQCRSVYFPALHQSLEFALKKTPRKNGLLPHDYTRGWRQNDPYDRMLLTHSAITELVYLDFLSHRS